MNNYKLENLINKKLNNNKIKDYVENGLQVEGKSYINNIITGVTACQTILNIALKNQIDAIIVHHGYFWKTESNLIKGIKKKRLQTLLINNINLYAWHLPLDIHPKLGNNAQLANLLNIKINGWLNSLVIKGYFINYINQYELKFKLKKILNHNILHYGYNAPKKIKNIALCSGRGQEYIQLAAESGMDAFITGEVSEQTLHIATEYGINFYACGHHATERNGIYALGNWLKNKYNLIINFIDIPNPA